MGLKTGDIRLVQVSVTDKAIRQFAEVSGDYNPIHLDDTYAAKTIYGRRIAHGMLMGAYISRAMASELGTGGVYLSQTLKFTAPVFVDDHLTIELKVGHVKADKGLATVETTVTKQTGEIVVKGNATIMLGPD